MSSEDFPRSGDDLLASRARYQRRRQEVFSQLAEAERDLESLRQERVEGLHGEAFTAERADDLAEELEQQIRADINRGHHRHTPASRGQKLLARIAPFADFLVFLYFLAVVLNVSWADPRQTPVEALLALVLAVIATAGVAYTLRSIAGRYRQNKPDDGRFRWRQRTRQGGVEVDRILLVTILAAVGMMMAYRVFNDARTSELPVAPSLLVAFFFGMVAVALNYIIFLVEFTDGSTVTDELRHLRTKLEPIEVQTTKARRRMRDLHQRLDALEAQGDIGPAFHASADRHTHMDAGMPTGRPTVPALTPEQPGRPADSTDITDRASVIDLDVSKRDGSSRLGQIDDRPAGVNGDEMRSRLSGESGSAPANG